MTCVQYLIDTDESIKLTVGREIYDKHFMSDLIPDLIPAPPPSMLLPFRRIPPFRTPPINVLPDPIEN